MARSRSTASLEGLKESVEAFREADPVFRKHLGGATRATANELAEMARRGVPVRYGNLRAFIVARYSNKSGFATVGIKGGTAVIPSSFEGIGPGGKVVTPARYARAVHEGTSRSRGVPFMLNAARQQQPRYATRINEGARNAERELAAKAPKVT